MEWKRGKGGRGKGMEGEEGKWRARKESRNIVLHQILPTPVHNCYYFILTVSLAVTHTVQLRIVCQSLILSVTFVLLRTNSSSGGL